MGPDNTLPRESKDKAMVGSSTNWKVDAAEEHKMPKHRKALFEGRLEGAPIAFTIAGVSNVESRTPGFRNFVFQPGHL